MAEEGRPQLRMWDEAGQESAIGSLDDGERRWQIVVVAEPVAEDLVRGWLSFRLEDEKHDTAPVILEETVELVIQRAVELPEPMLQQLFGSARR
jgi:hypothetical protein